MQQKKNVSRSLPVCLASRSISRAVRGARARAKSQRMRQSLFAHVHAFQSRKVSGLKLAPIATFSSIDRPLPFALFGRCFIYVNSLLSPDLFQCEARSREDLLRPSLVCLQMCSPRSQPQRKTRAFFFFCLSLSLYLPRAGAGGEQRTRRQVRASHASRLLLERALTSNYKWLVQRMKLPRPPY